MIKTHFFNPPSVQKSSMELIDKFELHKILENNRTKIYQNNDMRMCVDHNIIRILIYDENNCSLLEKIRGYFYGEEYTRL